MKFFKKPIFTGFMPNLLFKDVVIAMSFVLPWNWRKLQSGSYVKEFENRLQQLIPVKSATTFDSGRSSLQIALQVLGVQKTDEVLVQAYTCCVVSNAIFWAGGIPVYVDITDAFNMDPSDLEKKITPKAKAIIIQHTFGIPAEIEKLLAIAKKYNLKVIEDCAHVMGAEYKGKQLGTWGDIGMFSFGTEKPISAGRGGALVTDDENLAFKIKAAQKVLPHTSIPKILQQLITFKIFFICKPFYNIFVGKILLAIFKKLKLLTRIIEQSEKRGEMKSSYPTQFPNSLAKIALNQLNHLKKFNQLRKESSQKYLCGLEKAKILTVQGVEGQTLLRFPVRVKNPRKLHFLAQEEGILLGDWYNTVIAPKDADISKMGYVPGSCPNAEKLSRESINLPTSIHITSKDQQKIIAIANSYAE